jgi:hypothetical protein
VGDDGGRSRYLLWLLTLRFRYAMPGPAALRVIGSTPFRGHFARASADVCAGRGLILMSATVAVLGSWVFVQNTWF